MSIATDQSDVCLFTQSWLGSDVSMVLSSMRQRFIATDHALVIIGASPGQLAMWSAQLQPGKGKGKRKAVNDEDEDEEEEREGDVKTQDCDAIAQEHAVYSADRGCYILLKPIDRLVKPKAVFGADVESGLTLVLFTKHHPVPCISNIDPVLYYSCPIFDSR